MIVFDGSAIETYETLSGTERQYQIMRLVERLQRITVGDICEQFAVSEATARRDLEALASQGKLQRVHGGAIVVQQAPPELPMLQRQGEQSAEKERIGRAAAELVLDGETIFLGSGTTVLEVARQLKRSERRLTVITNSLPVINTLAETPHITLVSLGGMLRSSEFSFIGHITEQALAELRADKVIIGTRAISLEQGLTNDYLPETMTDRAILSIGQQVIVVADHTKLGCISTAFLAPIERVHTIVTDSQADREFIEAVTAQRIKVILA